MKKIGLLLALILLLIPPSITSVRAENLKTVNISTVDELLNAIASNTKIILAPGTYIIHEGRYTFDDGHMEYVNNLRLSDIENLEICGNKRAEIKLDVGYTAVVSILSSKNITLDGLILGHEAPKYGCEDGDVCSIGYSENIQIKNCDLYGCGVRGIRAEGVTNLIVSDTTIRDCMMGIANVWSDITFNRCQFLRNAYDKSLASTYAAFDDFYTMPSENEYTITLNQCTFIDNMNTTFADKNIIIRENNCTYRNNAWEEAKEPALHFQNLTDTKAEVSVTNYQALDAQVILAVYDKRGVLTYLAVKSPASTVTFTDLDLRNKNIKVMLWHNMKPLAQAIELKR